MNYLCKEFVAAVVTTFDEELLKFESKELSSLVGAYFNGLYMNRDLVTMGTDVTLSDIATSLFGDAVYRSFLLEVSERACMKCSWSEPEQFDEMVRCFAFAASRNKVPTSQSLIPTAIGSTIAVSNSTMEALFKSNVWLLTLYVLLAFFSRTEFHIAVVGSRTDSVAPRHAASTSR